MNVHIKDPVEKAQACVIWMHGLGADGSDMANLASELPLSCPCRHVFIDAPIRPVTLNNGMPMRAWYDILGMALTDREDHQGIHASQALILEVFNTQLAAGFPSKAIFLAGFSQGGAMALFTGLNLDKPIAGILALSAYIPLVSALHLKADKNTPIFVARGDYDPIVLPQWTLQSVAFLQSKGYQHIEERVYPMEHSVCAAELKDIAQFLSTMTAAIPQEEGIIK